MPQIDLKEETSIKDAINYPMPPKYKVIYLNDDVTEFSFVISTLMQIFHKSLQEAKNLTMKIHNTGSGVAGIFTYDIAKTKIEMTIAEARKNNFPLMLIMKEAK